MKQILPLILCLAVILISCNKQDDTADDNPNPDPNQNVPTPVKEQWGLAINYTATWCTYCGQWGAPLLHDFAAAGKVVTIAVHGSDDPMYKAALFQDLVMVRPVAGYPTFWVGDIKTNQMADMTDLLQSPSITGIAISSVTAADSMVVKTKVKFFGSDDGTFHLSVLLLEDGIDGSQSAGDYEQQGVSNPDTYKHDFVLRASANKGNIYGPDIIATPEPGDEVEGTYVFHLKESWSDVYPVAVLWKDNYVGDPSYVFVNAVK